MVRRVVSGDLPNSKEKIVQSISRSEGSATHVTHNDRGKDNLLLEFLLTKGTNQRVRHTKRVCNIRGRVRQEVDWEKPAEEQGIAEDYS